MSFKVKHRTHVSPPNKHVNTRVSMFLLELCVGVVCLFFAYSDWGNGKTIMFWPFVIVAVFCFFLVLYTFLEFLYLEYFVSDKNSISEKQD